MLLRLVVIEGPLKGEGVLIRDSIVIGRKGTDLNLQDSKASSKHAKIFTDESGVVKIEDLQSSNGTYVNEIKVATWALKAGDKVTIGKTTMIVEDQTVDKTFEKGSWQNVIEGALNNILTTKLAKHPETKACEPFQRPVVLEFVRGIQTGTSYTFGFGPRRVGKVCTEGLLFESQSPEIAFEVFPDKNALCEVQIKAEGVLLNGNKIEKNDNKKKLKDGDRLSIGQTVIVVKAFEKL